MLYLVYICLHTIESQTIEGKMASSNQDVGGFIGDWNLHDPSHMEVLLKDRIPMRMLQNIFELLGHKRKNQSRQYIALIPRALCYSCPCSEKQHVLLIP